MHKRRLLPCDSRIYQRVQHYLHGHENHTGYKCNIGTTKRVVTFNLAIYSKAKEIPWRHPNEFKHLVIRMGCFYIALYFLSVIGKKFEESGIADLLMESGLYGTTSTIALLKGKSYNRGLHVHKLIMEA